MRITVQTGDTLGTIARRFGTTVDYLNRLTSIQHPDRIFAGHTLEVPGTDAFQPPQGATPDGSADADELFTEDQLVEISRNPDPEAFDLAGDRAALVLEMKKGGIVTRNQIAAFLANVCQETDWLKTLEEYGDEQYFRYGPPGGDGVYLLDEWRYHGRGYIMLTWSDNYRAAGHAIGVGDRLVNEPDLLANDKELAAKTAVWFWTSRDCGRYADQDNFEAVCSLINRGEIVPKGPINHWAQRLEAYQRATSVIGAGTEPPDRGRSLRRREGGSAGAVDVACGQCAPSFRWHLPGQAPDQVHLALRYREVGQVPGRLLRLLGQHLLRPSGRILAHRDLFRCLGSKRAQRPT